MQYQVSREGTMYGPYTLEDLQRYVSQGNILPTDLAKNEEMAEWVPVSQLLGVAMPVAAPVYPVTGLPYSAHPAPSAYPASALTYPDPPNLHWGLVLLFLFLTCGIFGLIWEGIEAAWLKKVMPQSKVMLYYTIFIILEVVNLAISVGRMTLILGSHAHSMQDPMVLASSGIGAIVGLGVFVMVILFRFTMRGDLITHFNTVDPIGLRLGGVMTFFFGGLYFQYHFNRINEIKQSIRFRTPGV